MFLQPGQDVGEVKRRSICCADRVGERLEGYCTKFEGETLKGASGALGLVDPGACAGGVGIFGGPFGVGDLRRSAWALAAARSALTYSLSVFLPISLLEAQALLSRRSSLLVRDKLYVGSTPYYIACPKMGGKIAAIPGESPTLASLAPKQRLSVQPHLDP